MFFLLTKRLTRSLLKTKIRLAAVIAMVAVAVFAGISFAAYANTVSGIYDGIYEDDQQGVNLPDIWVENPSGTWDQERSESICEAISESWPVSPLKLNECELHHAYRSVIERYIKSISGNASKLGPWSLMIDLKPLAEGHCIVTW